VGPVAAYRTMSNALGHYEEGGLRSLTVERSLAILRSRVRISAGPLPGNSLGQSDHMHVPLSPSSIISYRPMCCDALRLGR